MFNLIFVNDMVVYVGLLVEMVVVMMTEIIYE